MNTENNNNQQEQVDVNFFNIVISLSQAAIVGMGKVTNPQTGKVEKNMPLARVNIDIIQMLKDKTKGNLTRKEEELITDTLTNLQLTYADELKRDQQQSEKKEEETKTNSKDTESEQGKGE